MNTEVLVKVTAGKNESGQYRQTILFVPLCNVSYFQPSEGDRFSVILKTGVDNYMKFEHFTASITPEILKKLVLNP